MFNTRLRGWASYEESSVYGDVLYIKLTAETILYKGLFRSNKRS